MIRDNIWWLLFLVAGALIIENAFAGENFSSLLLDTM